MARNLSVTIHNETSSKRYFIRLTLHKFRTFITSTILATIKMVTHQGGDYNESHYHGGDYPNSDDKSGDFE